MDKTSAQHWDRVYGSLGDNELSWFQTEPELSRRLVKDALAGTGGTSVIDVGAGMSPLLARLWDDGVRDLTALDISAEAVARLRKRHEHAGIEGIVADISKWRPARRWSVWHDRAVLHFLTEPAAQTSYLTALRTAVEPGGTAIIATFSLDGPQKCSGLPVQRYSEATLTERVGSGFRLQGSERELHSTPSGKEQAFVYSIFRRLP